LKLSTVTNLEDKGLEQVVWSLLAEAGCSRRWEQRLSRQFMGANWLPYQGEIAAINVVQANFSPLQCPPDQFHPIFRFGFGQDVAHVVVHCTLANFQARGNF
jgi:hypothetical protein